jgi:dienelactone hydrolase
MRRARWCAVGALLVAGMGPARADEGGFLKSALAREVLAPRQTLGELQDFLEARLPSLPKARTPGQWEKAARKLREDVLAKAVFRGEAARWRAAKGKVEWKETVAGGPGYRIRKLRYEGLPGLWIPALLYEPETLKGKVPVGLAVNGHDRNGKAADYKQVRCINMARRGMVVLNPEWFGMGQLNAAGYSHGCMNQLDLCGTSGLAPFYLAMSRGLDLLLAHPHADPKRVCVSGLSGGGWQTIVISSLDERVTLANPVAGYSGFRVRLRDHFKDLGDSEQTPVDLATVADYTHLTALRAPRPTLLTYNAKDECCFEAGYALPPLLKAATPVFKLYGREKALRSHVNHVPGTHNYGRDNREAFYSMLGDFFFAGDKTFNPKEIPSAKEVKPAKELTVDLPANNATFNTLARALAKSLPRTPPLPARRAGAAGWQDALRAKLRAVVRAPAYRAAGKAVGGKKEGDLTATFWKLELAGGDGKRVWTVPATELARGKPKGTVILLNDAGRRADPVTAARLLRRGYRVLAVDLFSFGEARPEKDWLFALLVSCVGERPLGVQAGQLNAVARWAEREFKDGPAAVTAVGPRLSLVALVAAGLEPRAVGGLELHGALGSLKEVVERNRSVEQMPEVFCFGLLEACDVRQLVALAAPRRVRVVGPGARARAELKGLRAWYGLLGEDHDPLGGK